MKRVDIGPGQARRTPTAAYTVVFLQVAPGYNHTTPAGFVAQPGQSVWFRQRDTLPIFCRCQSRHHPTTIRPPRTRMRVDFVPAHHPHAGSMQFYTPDHPR
jgi:hypothetical protein